MKKKWGAFEGQTDSVDAKTVRSAIEDQIPDIYEMFLIRHMKPKSIYARCKRKHFSRAQQHHSPLKALNLLNSVSISSINRLPVLLIISLASSHATSNRQEV
jgi:hypothetical protein